MSRSRTPIAQHHLGLFAALGCARAKAMCGRVKIHVHGFLLALAAAKADTQKLHLITSTE
jgi:hypothetical protein